MSNPNESVDLSEHLDLEELSLLVDKLAGWMSRYGPLEEIDEDDLQSEVENQLWSEVTLDNDVVLFSGIHPRAERFFLSKIASIELEDSPVTTAIFFACPLCDDSMIDKDEEEKPCSSCSFNRKLFLDLETLLHDSSAISINNNIEPA